MSGGASLPGIEVAGPRPRGRPKGSKNKRASDLKGVVDAKYGGSTALQMAAATLISSEELRAAGGSMARAQVAKALELVEFVRDAQGLLDEVLRDELRQVVRQVALELGGDRTQLQAWANQVVGRIKQAGGDFGLAAALTHLATARANLLPFTDQKQPQAVVLDPGKGMAAAMIMVGQEGGQAVFQPIEADPDDEEGETEPDQGFIEGLSREVSQPKSHEVQQTLALEGQEADPPADG